MKRIALFVLALVACSPAAPPETESDAASEQAVGLTGLAARLEGCWRGEDSGDVTGLSWAPDSSEPTQITGLADISLMSGGHGTESYALSTEDGEAWTFCETSAGQNDCHAVTETEPRGVDQVLIAVDHDSLRIVEPTPDGERQIIDGWRVECRQAN